MLADIPDICLLYPDRLETFAVLTQDTTALFKRL